MFICLFIGDEEEGAYEYTVDYYVLAQFSRFIPRAGVVVVVEVENTFGNEVWVTVNMTGGGQRSGRLLLGGSVTTWVLP